MANKRMSGEGSLRQRKDGRWEYRLTEGRRDDGKPIVTSFYGKTQSEVRKKLDAYRKQKLSGIDMTTKYTFSQWADIWFDNHTEVSATTKEGYRYTLRLLKNPVQYAKKLRSWNPTKEKEAFTAEEVRLLMAGLPQDFMGLTIRLMLGTGMRTQEMLALEPKHIFEDGSVIQIRQAVVRVKGSIAIGPPKSKDSTGTSRCRRVCRQLLESCGKPARSSFGRWA